MKVLYLLGLDGDPNWVDKTQAQIHGVTLVPFIYPTGRKLDWDSLTALVASRLHELQTGLLAGESFGGAVALKTAILHPAAVKGLCLIATFNREAQPFQRALGHALTEVLPWPMLDAIARRVAAKQLTILQGEEREKFLAKNKGLDHKERGRRLKLLKGFNVRDRLAGITCPTEIMYGTEDATSTARNQLEFWERIPNAQVHGFEPFRHMITQEIPQKVAQRIEAWVARIGP